MKSVVHISTSDREGGAAIAAWRLHEGLRALGMDSRVVSRHRSGTGDDVSCISSPLFEAADLFHHNRVVPAQPEGATLFSLTPTSIPLLDHPWIAAADIVHLHWVALFIAPENIAELCKSGKIVFWTFHDQWPYTGGCHYLGSTAQKEPDWEGVAQINTEIHQFAKLELLRKKSAFSNSSINVIAPSRWMAEEAVGSGIFTSEQINVIPYGINTTIFRPAKPDSKSEQIGYENNKVVLVFGCQYLGDRRKGYRELRQALSLCVANPAFAKAAVEGQICAKTFGGIPQDGSLDLPIPVSHLGMLATEPEVAEVFQAASAFICPALEDNLPNVVMESLACGCPVLAFNTGGLPDMVSHGKNGLLASKGDVEALARCLIDFCLNDTLRQQLRDGAKKSDPDARSLATQASSVLALYDAAAPNKKSGSDGKPQSSLHSLSVCASIVPEYQSPIVQVLLEAKASCEYLAWETNEKLIRASQQLAGLHAQLNELEIQLQNERATTEQKQLKVKELKSKLNLAVRQRRKLQLRLTKIKNRRLVTKKSVKRKSTVRRLGLYILRKFKGKCRASAGR